MVTLVAVPGRLSPKAQGVRTPALAAGQTYLRAVRRAGAEAAVVLPESGLAAGLMIDLLGRFDGLLLLGGGDLEALRGVVKFPVRIKCATLAWNTLSQALDAVSAER